MTLDEFYHLEEDIDAERERIGKAGTPVNEVTFLEWKKKRDAFRSKGKEAEEKKKKSGMTGIELFKKQSNLFKDDDNAEDVEREENQLEEETKDLVKALRTDMEMMEELDNDMKGIKINAELFQEENLDEFDGIDEDEVGNNVIQEEEKDYDN